MTNDFGICDMQTWSCFLTFWIAIAIQVIAQGWWIAAIITIVWWFNRTAGVTIVVTLAIVFAWGAYSDVLEIRP